MDPVKLCSPCVIQLFKDMQRTAYSNYNEELVSDWQAIQTICKTGSLPTEPQPLAVNLTRPESVTEKDPAVDICDSGNKYTVVSGDTVGSIANKFQVSTGPLMFMNGIFPDESNLEVGAELCLPVRCPIYKVTQNDDCASIASSHDTTFAMLRSWNAAINLECSNLVPNTNICVGPSNPEYTPTAIPNVTPAPTNIYATETVVPSGPTASGTTKNCGKYYEVQSGDDCTRVSLSNSITLDLFRMINPDIDSNCYNLMLGVWYCVWPTANWNATEGTTTILPTTVLPTTLPPTTTSKGPVPPPGPTQAGIVPHCNKWVMQKDGMNNLSIFTKIASPLTLGN